MSYFAHPSAEVAPGAEIGAGAKIWHDVQVLPGARVGDGTIIGKGVYVDHGVRIGSRVKIQNYALLYRGSVVEDEVFLGPGAVLTNDRHPRATNPDGTMQTDADWREEGVVVRRGASIGTNAVVLPGVEVGPHAMVAAGAIVTRDVPAYGLVAGAPARLVGHACRCGRRLDAAGLRCAACGRTYVETADGLTEAPPLAGHDR